MQYQKTKQSWQDSPEEMDELVRIASGLLWGSGMSFKDVAEAAREHDQSGLSVSTVSKLAYGDTRRPQARTLKLVLKALGYRIGVFPETVHAHAEVVPDERWETSFRQKRSEREKKRRARKARIASRRKGK